MSDEILTYEVRPGPPECGHQAGEYRCQMHKGHEGDHRGWSWRADSGIITHSWSPNWIGLVGVTAYVPPEPQVGHLDPGRPPGFRCLCAACLAQEEFR